VRVAGRPIVGAVLLGAVLVGPVPPTSPGSTAAHVTARAAGGTLVVEAAVSTAVAAIPALPDSVRPLSWEAERGTEALALIDFPWQELGWRVDFLPARDGLLGMAYPQRREIEVYVRDSQPVERIAVVVAHEIAHALDLERNTASRRQAWLALRGLPADTPWFGCSGCVDYATGSGDFAEVFAAWQVGPIDFRSRLAPLPTEEQWPALIRLFEAP
jgi:hypothetical protein